MDQECWECVITALYPICNSKFHCIFLIMPLSIIRESLSKSSFSKFLYSNSWLIWMLMHKGICINIPFSCVSSNILDGEDIPFSLSFVLLNKYISLDLFSWWSLFPRSYFSKLELLIIYVVVLIITEKNMLCVVHEWILYKQIQLGDSNRALLQAEIGLGAVTSFLGKNIRKCGRCVCLG